MIILLATWLGRRRSVTREERGGGGGEEMRMVVRNSSLAEVAAGLEEYFLKASVGCVAGDAMSSHLESSMGCRIEAFMPLITTT
ncbi:Os05g0547200 [Oryza sativa Japonica Group]|uniref:Os05g0547200 protein n=1 Tax=Oryza sativa subsp. japonica TaxID=39947 RepID=A0A0N7KL68_ORYSJ|nr:Os05g0547200 [Oryza sativa Japonica Group]